MLRYTIRTLLRTRGFTLAALICLTLGIGATSAASTRERQRYRHRGFGPIENVAYDQIVRDHFFQTLGARLIVAWSRPLTRVCHWRKFARWTKLWPQLAPVRVF